MRYSDRQQHCLQAMGIVPWVSRLPEDIAALAAAGASLETEQAASPDNGDAALANAPETVASAAEAGPRTATASATASATAQQTPPEPLPATTAPAPVSESAPVPASTATATTPVAATMSASIQPPVAASDLGGWLQAQTLASIEFRGGMHPVLGVAEAPLLVVLALDHPSPTAGSMAGDDGRLFELMLRSIDMSNRDTRRCLLARRAADSEISPDSPARLDSLYTPGTRGVLMLMSPWTFDEADDAVELHQTRLPGSGLPVWRIAHPALLLEQPQLKRQAWQVLKNIRATLDGAVR